MKLRTISAVILAAMLAPQLAQAQGLDRLSIHGYMTQGFGIADGGTIFGIPEDGTTDYRNAALQFRYALSSNDNVTLQLSHSHSARSSLASPDADALEIDWAFYGRSFGDLEVKVGRAAIPAGIYNEVRDVGVLLPFYRPSITFYGEGSYTTETVDGAVVSYRIAGSSEWSAEISAYGGEWDVVSRGTDNQTGQYFAMELRATAGLGGGIWINTPVDGVRFGGGASRYEAALTQTASTWKEWHGSLDISLPQFTVQAEARRTTFDMGHNFGWYTYAGFRPVPQLTLHGMVDIADLSYTIPGMGALDVDYHRDYAMGANYALSPNVVFKLEAHRTEGILPDEPVSIIGMTPPVQVDYLLFSVSTAF